MVIFYSGIHLMFIIIISKRSNNDNSNIVFAIFTYTI